MGNGKSLTSFYFTLLFIAMIYFHILLINFIMCMLSFPYVVRIYYGSIYSKSFCVLNLPHILLSSISVLCTFQAYYLQNWFTHRVINGLNLRAMKINKPLYYHVLYFVLKTWIKAMRRKLSLSWRQLILQQWYNTCFIYIFLAPKTN